MKKLIIVLSCLVTSVTYSKEKGANIFPTDFSKEHVAVVADTAATAMSIGMLAGRVLPALKGNPRALGLWAIIGAGIAFLNQNNNNPKYPYTEKVENKALISFASAAAFSLVAPTRVLYSSALKSLLGAVSRTPIAFSVVYGGLTAADTIQSYPKSLFNLQRTFAEAVNK